MNTLENMNLVAPINQTSYGLTSLNIIKALMDINVKISLFPISLNNDIPDYFIPYVQKAIQNARLADFYAPTIRLYHQFDMSLFAGNGTRIGFPIFELDGFTDIELNHLSSLEHCFVCSNWAKQLLMKHKVLKDDQISVIPLGVDEKIFNPNMSVVMDDTFRFLNVGKWEIRKGHDVLPDIFTYAFSSADNVKLLMCNHNVHLTDVENKEWERYYQSKIPAHQLEFIPRVKTQQELASLMNNVDCGIFPSRAEGWNLEAVEMLACGKDIVITNETAHTEYCKDLPYTVNCPEKELAFDGKWFFNQGLWHKIGEQQIKSLSAIMRQAYNNRNKNHEQNLAVVKKFTWEKTSAAIVNAIERIER